MKNVTISVVVPFHRQGKPWGHLAVLYQYFVDLSKPVCLLSTRQDLQILPRFLKEIYDEIYDVLLLTEKKNYFHISNIMLTFLSVALL